MFKIPPIRIGERVTYIPRNTTPAEVFDGSVQLDFDAQILSLFNIRGPVVRLNPGSPGFADLLLSNGTVLKRVPKHNCASELEHRWSRPYLNAQADQ